MARHAAITGWGHYVPERTLTNKQLEALVETSDEWIRSRTGIGERRLAAANETTASMCIRAAEQALDRARLAAWDVDLIICGTTTPDTLLPATGCLVQDRLGAANAGAFDLNAACCGFLYGLITGSQFIQAGTCQRVLVVAGETLSRFTNWKDRGSCILFGDGAGAVVLEATDKSVGVRAAVLGCRGDADGMLTIPAGGSAKPASAATLGADEHTIHMRGNEVFKVAVRGMVQSATTSLAKAGLTATNLRKVLVHQANLRILKATQGALKLPDEKMFVNIERYGNTGAASLGIALSEFLTADPTQLGDELLLLAFGGGLTWASAVVRWADVEAVIREREGKADPARKQAAAAAAAKRAAAITP